MPHIKSKCCDARIDCKETGVSQMSYNEEFYCSECGRKLDVRRKFENRGMTWEQY